MDVILRDFSPEQISNSGQCFRIFKLDDNTWKIYHSRHFLIIKQLSTNHYSVNCTDKEWKNIWYNYFDLNTDYSLIQNIILNSDDMYLRNAVNVSSGLRILRQDLFETIVTFIISQNNNIPRITKIINSICTPYFPDISELAEFSIKDWQLLGTGYRAKYLYEAIRKIYSGIFDLYKLTAMNYQSAITYLKTLSGIGDKVANCIALFGLHHMNAFPQDVWIKKIINTYYNGNFPVEKYRNWLGIVQQYMFYYERCYS